MSKELKDVATFRDNNDQSWDIGVYEIEGGGNGRFSTVVRSPEGEYYRPEDDFFGDLKLIDRNGKSHDGADLPLNMDLLQEAVEKVEAGAWLGQTVTSRIADGQLTQSERAKWDDIIHNFDETTPEPRAQTEQSDAKKGGWAERMREQIAAKRGKGSEIGG